MGGQIEGEPKEQAARCWSQWGSRRSGIWKFGGKAGNGKKKEGGGRKEMVN